MNLISLRLFQGRKLSCKLPKQRWKSWSCSRKILRAGTCTQFCFGKCCRSITFFYGSGFADPCLCVKDPDLDPGSEPAIFVNDINFCSMFFCLFLFEGVHLHHKLKKKSLNSRNQGFAYFFYFMIEGSASGSVPLTNGSGSRRSKNIRIRRIRIWIRNTGFGN